MIVGSQGVGKTLFLRRMFTHFASDESVESVPPVLEASELNTTEVVRFSQIFAKNTNSQHWSRIWMRALELSAAKHILYDSIRHGSSSREDIEGLRSITLALLPNADIHSAVDILAFLIGGISGRTDYTYIDTDPRWVSLRESLIRVAAGARELYLFIDAIDDNFRHAPAYWLQCQRGLFYAVMNLMRTQALDNKLHIVISIRDLVFSSILRSEHGARYMNDDTITTLRWNFESCAYFLRAKLDQLKPRYFQDPDNRTVQSFFGRMTIRNEMRRLDEPIEQYVIRHTRLSPRDVILIGNLIIEEAEELGCLPFELDDKAIRHAVARGARISSKGVLAQVANQIVTNSMPWSSSRHHFTEVYTQTDEYTADGLVRELMSVLYTIETEVFDSAALDLLDEEAQKRWGANAHLTDVLWQNRLLGTFERETPIFYEGAKDDETTVPDADWYILNPLLLDRLPRLVLKRGRVYFPGVRNV